MGGFGVGDGRRAKIFMNKGNQAVRIPKDFEFAEREVFVRKVGDVVMLSLRPRDWQGLTGAVASSGFMLGMLESEKLDWSER
jgi:virulence-associated protein VagC